MKALAPLWHPEMCHLYVCGLGTRHARFKREWATTGKASYAPKNIARVHPSCLLQIVYQVQKNVLILPHWQYFAIRILNLPHISDFLRDIFVKDFHIVLKFIYSEKAFRKISTLLLPGATQNKSKVEILQNFVAFSQYTNVTIVEIC